MLPERSVVIWRNSEVWEKIKTKKKNFTQTISVYNSVPVGVKKKASCIMGSGLSVLSLIFIVFFMKMMNLNQCHFNTNSFYMFSCT